MSGGTSLTGSFMYPKFILTCSLALIDRKGANEVTKTLNPSFASPAAIPIKFCSLIPTDKYLFGYMDLNLSSPDDLPRSADKTIRFSLFFAISSIN